MRRKIAAIIGVLLAMSLMVGTPVPEQAYAAAQPDLGIAPYTTYIKQAYATLNISGSNATIYGYVCGTPGVTTQAKVTVYLQKKSGSTWSNVGGPWTSGTVSGTVASKSATKSGLSSGTYRAKAICQVYQGSWESKTVYGS